eukprot:TRINITY_DN1376_c0_g1_i4.p1 TRINITY_DN1376_c0_g1~~TRINITY_DN1376_c0_g1_i4.p1  ORF type:complete len:268 (-),score=41.25 TRINITY_DN1376_c0_g1_i4:309-1112(-)
MKNCCGIGCGNTQLGTFLNGPGWTVYDAVDGLLGLGQGALSVLNFLQGYGSNSSALPTARKVFTLCLGAGYSGGLLAFGDGHVPKHVVYTPIVPNSLYYRVSVVGVSVDGHAPSVPPSAYGDIFAGNAVFDSGTTFTFVPPTFQKTIMNMIKLKVGLTPSVNNPLSGDFVGFLCYAETDSLTVSEIALRFPTINLQFAGPGLFLNVAPASYTFIADGSSTREICTRLVPWSGGAGVSFLIGDAWMRNLLLVHDLENQRIGWTPTQCF